MALLVWLLCKFLPRTTSFILPSVSVPSFASDGAGQPTNIAGYSLISSAGHVCFLFSFFPPFQKGFSFFSAYASRVGETKPSSNEAYSRASGWLSSSDQWTCWRWRGVSLVIFSCSFLEPNCACISMLTVIFCHRNILGQLAEAIPQAVQVTPEEREAIERVCHLFA